MVRRRRLSYTLAAVGAFSLGVSGVLFTSRFVPSDGLPARSDTAAMLSAFTDFAAPGFIVATVLALAALALRDDRPRKVLVVACLAASAVQGVVLVPRWTADPVVAHRGSFTLLALNSRLGQADPADLMRYASSADVVVLTEVNRRQVDDLDELGFSRRFPHRNAGRLPTQGGAGTAVFSIFPITGTERLSSALRNQSWITTLEVPGSPVPVTVVAVHPARPHQGKDRWLGEQNALRAALPTSGPRLLAGDFNAVASQPTLRTLSSDGWTSAVDQAGSGWVPTYPANAARLPPLLDIDHIYLSEGLQSTSLRSVLVHGTDHLGLLATVDITAAG